jgi:hypothetical protein
MLKQDALSISGKPREQAHRKTSDHQKQVIVHQFYKRKEHEAIIKSLPPLNAIDSLRDKELTAAVEKVLNDPVININGAAQSNLLRTLSDDAKRAIIKQYITKKDPKKLILVSSPTKKKFFQMFNRKAIAVDTGATANAPSSMNTNPSEGAEVPANHLNLEHFITQLCDR